MLDPSLLLLDVSLSAVAQPAPPDSLTLETALGLARRHSRPGRRGGRGGGGRGPGSGARARRAPRFSIVLIWAFVRYFSEERQRRSEAERTESAEEILRVRFGRGEIDEDEFARRMKTLRESRGV